MVPLALFAISPCASALRAPDSTRLRAVVISDINDAYGSTSYSEPLRAVMERITGEWRPDVVLAAGDLVAGQAPHLPDSIVHEMWAAFDRAVAAPLREAGIPLIATLGNHDASAYPGHARDRGIAAEYWRGTERTLAEPLDGAHLPFRYTVRAGPVFVAVWDGTTEESARDPELVDWLRRSLATREARAARHRVILSHLPLYAVAEGRDRPGELLSGGDSLRRRLEAWGATLFISGHHHAYYPGRRGALEMLHTGALGGGPRPLIGDTAAPRRTVTIADFDAESLRLTTYVVSPDGTLSDRPLSIDALPRVVCGRSGWVARRDVADSPAAANDRQTEGPMAAGSRLPAVGSRSCESSVGSRRRGGDVPSAAPSMRAHRLSPRTAGSSHASLRDPGHLR